MTHPFPVVDLHCDLLEYLARANERTPYEEKSRCAYPQLKNGGVILQITAIFTETKPGSTRLAQAQIERLLKLPLEHPGHFLDGTQSETFAKNNGIYLIPSIENASGVIEENEPIAQGLQRLSAWHKALKRILYISLTWNGKNRFGGGTGSDQGLTDDGKMLLDWMSAHHIAVDLSHASDALAEEILNHSEQNGLNLKILASHSNFRAICPHPRNLPDWLAQEIIRRQGLIGLNLFAPFVHKTDPEALFAHIEYALSLGAQDTLSFGADFFDTEDFSALLAKHQCKAPYFPDYADASCYPLILERCAQRLSLGAEVLQKISSENALKFLTRSI
jgi:microsomal dipeptidase-like Zn-dependent dipeptidase